MAGRASAITEHAIDQPERAPDGRRSRWTEHRAQRRRAFVSAGVQAIDRYGADASAEQIAGIAQVSRTVLYRYFRDREDLRQAIADRIVASVVASVLPSLQLNRDSTPHGVIEATVGVIVGWLDEHPNLYHFLRGRRTGATLEAVENTLAEQVAALLRVFLTSVGLDAAPAPPLAYGIVGLVESCGGWWLAKRTMSRESFTELVCTAVWHLLEGAVRAHDIDIGYDDPLPGAALARNVSR